MRKDKAEAEAKAIAEQKRIEVEKALEAEKRAADPAYAKKRDEEEASRLKMIKMA